MPEPKEVVKQPASPRMVRVKQEYPNGTFIHRKWGVRFGAVFGQEHAVPEDVAAKLLKVTYLHTDKGNRRQTQRARFALVSAPA